MINFTPAVNKNDLNIRENLFGLLGVVILTLNDLLKCGLMLIFGLMFKNDLVLVKHFNELFNDLFTKKPVNISIKK